MVSCIGPDSSTIIGEWEEYRADDPTDNYLLSHLEFKETGVGAFWLTDGSTIRTKIEFQWEQEGTTIHTFSSLGGNNDFSFSNGLVVEDGGLGQIVYKKKK